MLHLKRDLRPWNLPAKGINFERNDGQQQNQAKVLTDPSAEAACPLKPMDVKGKWPDPFFFVQRLKPVDQNQEVQE
jgi:hypothetical protein